MMFFKKKPLSQDEDKVDTDLQPAGEQKTVAGSIGGDEYDHTPPPPPPTRNEELEASIEGEEGLRLEYTYNGTDVKEGLNAFQRATTFKKNMVYTLILLGVFGVYMFNIIKSPNETLSMFLGIMCIAALGILWIMPKGHIKRVAAFTDENPNSYVMTVYNGCVRVGDGERSFLYSYAKEISLLIETQNLFLVCASKEQIFILPKRCLDAEQMETAREKFKAGMGQKFLDKTL